jgi:hypothetical protein
MISREVHAQSIEHMDAKGTIEPARPERDSIEALRRRLGRLDPHQIRAWREMKPSYRLELAFQAYQLAIEAVRLTERQRHPGLPSDELAWRVTRRMQGIPN